MPKRRGTMGAGMKKLALDLWEIADDYGVEVVSPARWCQRYRKGVKIESAMRNWERLKLRIRNSPFPVEFVPCLVENKMAPGETASVALADTYWNMRGLGIRLPRGSRQELAKILDGQYEVEYE